MLMALPLRDVEPIYAITCGASYHVIPSKSLACTLSRHKRPFSHTLKTSAHLDVSSHAGKPLGSKPIIKPGMPGGSLPVVLGSPGTPPPPASVTGTPGAPPPPAGVMASTPPPPDAGTSGTPPPPAGVMAGTPPPPATGTPGTPPPPAGMTADTPPPPATGTPGTPPTPAGMTADTPPPPATGTPGTPPPPAGMTAGTPPPPAGGTPGTPPPPGEIGCWSWSTSLLTLSRPCMEVPACALEARSCHSSDLAM